MEGYIDLKTLTLDELVGVVNLYPWFGNARKELCSRLADMGDGETAYAAIAEASMYVSSRKALADMMRSREKKDCSDKDIDNILKRYIAGDAGKSGAGDKSGRKVLVVGGDYFSQEQYDRIKQSDGTVFPKFSLKVSGNEGPAGGPDDGFPEFYTETLAQIYAEQGYPEQAKKIYSKLILAYPEKNAYFAALIQKLEQEN